MTYGWPSWCSVCSAARTRRGLVDRPIDGRERALALLGALHVEHEPDGEGVVAHQPLLAKQVGARHELAEGVDLGGRGLEPGLGTPEHREGGVGGDMRDRRERALDAIDPCDHRRRQRVVGLRQEERELAGAEHVLEVAGGDVVGIARRDEPIDGIVLPNLRGEVRARGQQQRVARQDVPPPGDDDREDPRQPPCLHLLVWRLAQHGLRLSLFGMAGLGFPWRLRAVRVEMEALQHVVDDRCQHHTGQHEEHHTGQQGVTSGQPLPRGRAQWIDGPHPTQQHRRVQEGIRPAEPFDPVIDRHPERQRADAQWHQGKRSGDHVAGEMPGPNGKEGRAQLHRASFRLRDVPVKRHDPSRRCARIVSQRSFASSDVQPSGQKQDEDNHQDDAADPGWCVPEIMVAPVGQATEDEDQQDNKKQKRHNVLPSARRSGARVGWAADCGAAHAVRWLALPEYQDNDNNE